MSTKEFHRGLILCADEHDPRGFTQLWFEKVRRALALIERTAPRSAKRIRLDVRRIVVSDVEGPDYVHTIRAVRLWGPAIVQQEVRDVAFAIIHEATHARIARQGVRYSRDNRDRHERACTRAEVRFAQKLPGGEDLTESIMSKLDSPWWTDDKMRARKLEEFDRLDLKGPIARFMRRRIENRSDF